MVRLQRTSPLDNPTAPLDLYLILSISIFRKSPSSGWSSFITTQFQTSWIRPAIIYGFIIPEEDRHYIPRFVVFGQRCVYVAHLGAEDVIL